MGPSSLSSSQNAGTQHTWHCVGECDKNPFGVVVCGLGADHGFAVVDRDRPLATAAVHVEHALDFGGDRRVGPGEHAHEVAAGDDTDHGRAVDDRDAPAAVVDHHAGQHLGGC